MDGLPLEIKQHLCSFLTPKHLKPLRLTSKVFAAVAIPHFVPRIFLFNHPDSCVEVRKIANHPEMSKYVNTIIIDPTEVQCFESFEEWVDNLPHSWAIPRWSDFDPGASTHPTLPLVRWSNRVRRAKTEYTKRFVDAKYSKKKLLNFWELHRMLQEAQHEESAMDIEMGNTISWAFSKCSNLKNVVITGFHLQAEEGSKRRKKMFKDVKLAFPERGTITSMLAPQSELVLKDVLSDRLQTLTIKNVELNDWNFGAMKDLRHLHVTIRSCQRDLGSEFGLAIQTATSLETLWIDYPSAGHPDFYSLDSLLQAIHLENIRECLFSCASATDIGLANFFLRHARSLHSFGLGGLRLKTGSWPSLFRSLSCKLPLLKKVTLMGLNLDPGFKMMYKSSYTRAAQMFIMYGGLEPTEKSMDIDSTDDDDDSSGIRPSSFELQDGLWEDYDHTIDSYH